MRFISENGMIIDPNDEIITTVSGHLGYTDFPEEFMWELNKRKPGHVFEIAHTHPPYILDLSDRDKKTLKTWAFALYPFPIRMSVLSHDPDSRLFYYKRFLGILEPKEAWIAKGRGIREFKIMREKMFSLDDSRLNEAEDWKGVLLRQSYQLEENG